MKNHGVSIEQDCLESLLAALVQKGLREELAVPLLDRLRAAKVQITGKLMAATLAEERSPERAERAGRQFKGRDAGRF